MLLPLTQAICAEGKVRGGASVVNQAPAAKRTLERFVFEMHSLFLQAGEPPEAITVGFLKHRDIEGNAMPSQVGALRVVKEGRGRIRPGRRASMISQEARFYPP